jgi:hypothetical protein
MPWASNHHNLYVRNLKNGEDFVHLAQAGNDWTENHLVTSRHVDIISGSASTAFSRTNCGELSTTSRFFSHARDFSATIQSGA